MIVAFVKNLTINRQYDYKGWYRPFRMLEALKGFLLNSSAENKNVDWHATSARVLSFRYSAERRIVSPLKRG